MFCRLGCLLYTSCGRTQDQVRKMIAGAGNNNVYICDECIELCSEILEEELDAQEEETAPGQMCIRDRDAVAGLCQDDATGLFQ